MCSISDAHVFSFQIADFIFIVFSFLICPFVRFSFDIREQFRFSFDWMAMPRALRASRQSKNVFGRKIEDQRLENRTRKQQSVVIPSG